MWNSLTNFPIFGWCGWKYFLFVQNQILFSGSIHCSGALGRREHKEPGRWLVPLAESVGCCKNTEASTFLWKKPNDFFHCLMWGDRENEWKWKLRSEAFRSRVKAVGFQLELCLFSLEASLASSLYGPNFCGQASFSEEWEKPSATNPCKHWHTIFYIVSISHSDGFMVFTSRIRWIYIYIYIHIICMIIYIYIFE